MWYTSKHICWNNFCPPQGWSARWYGHNGHQQHWRGVKDHHRFCSQEVFQPVLCRSVVWACSDKSENSFLSFVPFICLVSGIFKGKVKRSKVFEIPTLKKNNLLKISFTSLQSSTSMKNRSNLDIMGADMFRLCCKLIINFTNQYPQKATSWCCWWEL